MLRLERSLCLALILCLLLAARQLPFSAACAALREDTLRLHVVANSDSESDQAVKLAVRDALLTELSYLEAACSRDDATRRAAAALPRLQRAAEAALAEAGFGYGARLFLAEDWFPRKRYGEATLPAGRYTALRVELGAAGGHNWWCVLYPALCLPAAQSARPEGWSAEEEAVVYAGDYEVRFFIEDWLCALRERLRTETA